jgi:phenylpropionate dioxygenase-like ring-hydroxylating dioxygenase large terminal subunit
MITFSALRRHWFPLCRSAELAHRPLSRSLLGAPLVLFRDANGRAAALADRCPHRNAPLSAGWVRGGQIVCPYHGWRFDGEGVCQQVPGLCGPAAHHSRVAGAYRAAEQGGLVWVTLGGAGEPPAPPPAQPGHTTALRVFTLRARLADALENFLDATHTHFVHAGLVRGEGRRRRVTAIVRGGLDRVEAEYQGEGQQSGLVSRLFGAGVDRSLGRFILPATVELEYRTARRTALLLTMQFTPERERELRVFVRASGRTAPLPGWVLTLPLALLLGHIVRQDRHILALQLGNVERFGGEHFSSTELDVMRPHIARLLRGAAAEPPQAAEPFERRVELLL